MTITTNHSIGEQVFYLASNGVIKSSKIVEVIASANAKSTETPISSEIASSVKYRLQDGLGITRPEDKLFKSEKELAASLITKAPEAVKTQEKNKENS